MVGGAHADKRIVIHQQDSQTCGWQRPGRASGAREKR